jgi:hypothetical protein
MKKYRILASVFAFTLIAGCSGNDTSSTNETPPISDASTPPVVPSDKTIEINGKSFTCGETIGASNSTCDENFQKAFNLWGDNIVAYMDSGQLGPLGNNLKGANNPDALMRYEDVVARGLGACIFAANGEGMGDMDAQTKFVNWMAETYPDEDHVAFLPIWTGANGYLCPDGGGDGSFQSHDLRVD